jgi:hypothetical protein
MFANATLAFGGQKRPKYRLKKNKFTLSSSETTHPSIVVDFRTLLFVQNADLVAILVT